MILRRLREAENEFVTQQTETISLQSQMWAEVGLSSKSSNDDVLSGQYLDALRLNRAIKEDQAMSIMNLRHMEEHAYFGRVDFHRSGSDHTRSTYIGISTLYDPDTQDILICDWRAPISSLFYENATGKVAYDGPNGPIEGELTGKRQYKCDHDQLVYCLDSTVTIQDEVLQETLSRRSDAQMHNIVSTIQEHQNRIICENIRSRVAVQGVAGSGKTAIALHRVAWLLYRYRKDALDYNQILFLTPNRAFVNYIRDVLPELGEQNIPTSTLFDEAARLIPSAYSLESPSASAEERLESVHSTQGQLDIAVRACLSGEDIWKLLDDFLKEKDEAVSFPDFEFDGEVLARARALHHLYITRSAETPMGRRMLRVMRHMTDILGQLYESKMKDVTAEYRSQGYRKKEAAEMAAHDLQTVFEPLAGQMRKHLTMDTREYFLEFLTYLKEKIPNGKQLYRILIREWLEKNALSQELTVIYALMRVRLYGAPANRYRHVLVDEAQNYSPMQVHLVEQLYSNCGMTVLMDTHQHMNLGMPEGSWDFCETHLTMDICYRSTKELTMFTRALLPDPDRIKPFEREGKKPVLAHVESLDGEVLHCVLKRLENPGRIAVITRSKEDAEHLFKEVVAFRPDMRLLTADDRDPASDLSIVPSWLCQGLEFDTVLVADPSAYCLPQEQGILYTVCSRAQHELWLLDPSGHYDPDIDSSLYDEITIE